MFVLRRARSGRSCLNGARGGGHVGRQEGADPAAPLDVIQLVGYVGKSTRADHHRLYMSLQLDEYVDIPVSAVVHHEDIPDTEMQHGGTRVWVDAGAKVVHEVRHTTQTEARFLEGSIADEYLQDATADDSQFGMPYTPYCRTNEPDCTARSCATCFRCPREVDDQQFGTLPPTRIVSCVQTCFRTCGPTCVQLTCGGTCLGTCRPTCRVTCVATCLGTCGVNCFTRQATCRPTCGVTCLATCRATCLRTCNVAACTLRCPITRQAGCLPDTLRCPVGTAICPVTPGCPFQPPGDGGVETGPGPVEQPAPAFGAAYDPGYGYHDPYGAPAWYWYAQGYPPWRR
jgi:hypothetical protein